MSRRCGGARVDLLTHSLGGLVVRSLLADFPAEFEALVRRGGWVGGWVGKTHSWSSLRPRPPAACANLSATCAVGRPCAQVGRWVALGCPFGGAPGYTLDALLTGVQFGGSLGDLFFVKRESFLQVGPPVGCGSMQAGRQRWQSATQLPLAAAALLPPHAVCRPPPPPAGRAAGAVDL